MKTGMALIIKRGITVINDSWLGWCGSFFSKSMLEKGGVKEPGVELGNLSVTWENAGFPPHT